MIVVSDSTTLIILSDLDKLIYLKNLFATIYIPSKVYEEINFKRDFELPDYIQIIKPKKTSQLQELKMLLDDGESEAIALAIEKELPLIIDEKKGRKIAKNLSLDILGLLGVIYLNIKKEFISIDDARDFIQKAKSNNYRIATQLIEEMFDNL
jgi:predicted nucleic acid-binding protein